MNWGYDLASTFKARLHKVNRSSYENKIFIPKSQCTIEHKQSCLKNPGERRKKNVASAENMRSKQKHTSLADGMIISRMNALVICHTLLSSNDEFYSLDGRGD